MSIDAEDLLDIDPSSIRNIADFSRALSKAKEVLSELKEELGDDVAKNYARQLTAMSTSLGEVTNNASRAEAQYSRLESKIKSFTELLKDPAYTGEARVAAEAELNRLTAQRPALLNAAIAAERGVAGEQESILRQSQAQYAQIARAAASAAAAKSRGAWQKPIIDVLEKIPRIGGLITMLRTLGKLSFLGTFVGAISKVIMVATLVYRRFKQIEESAKEFRVSTGITSDMMVNIKNAAVQINLKLAKFGVLLKDAFSAAQSLYEEFQTTDLIKPSDMLNLAKWNANIGLGTKEVAKIKSLFTSIAESTGISVNDTILLGTALAKAGGVAPSAVMKDIAEASEDALIFMAKSPLQMMKTAVEARRLGTSLKSIADSAKGFLNYQDSITAELEASALLGKSLNFQESRLLAYNKDILGSRREALRVIEEAGDFTSLDPYTQAAIARAAKMTTEEIIKQTNQKKMLALLEASTDKDDIKRAKEYKRLLESIGEQSKENLQIDINKARADADRQNRQTKIEQIANRWTAATTNVIDSMMPVIDMVLPTLERVVGELAKEMDSIAKYFREDPRRLQAFADVIKLIIEGVGKIIKPFIISLRDLTYVLTTLTEAYFELKNPIMDFFFGIKDGTQKANEELNTFQRTMQYISDIVGGTYEFFYDMITPIASFATRMTLAGNTFSGMAFALEMMQKGLNFFNGARSFSGLISAASTLQSIGTYFTEIPQKISTFVNSLGAIGRASSFIGSVYRAVSSLVGAFGKVFAFLRIGAGFLKFVPVLGKIITVVELFYRTVRGFMDLRDEWDNLSWGERIAQGLLVIPKAIFKTIVGSFVGAYEAVKDWFGFSPSKNAMKIVTGFVSVQSRLRKALTDPFNMAYEDINKKQKTFLKESIEKSGKSLGESIKDAWATILSRLEELWNGIKARTSEAMGYSNAGSAKPSVNTLSKDEQTAEKPARVAATANQKTYNPEELSKLDSKRFFANQTPIINVNTDTSALEAKMDDIIKKITDKPLVVNLDTMRISRGLAGTA